MEKTIAKIFCMTKDEYDLIEDFIVYHGYLFGYDNIVIIDNNSTDSRVIDVYEKYKLLGLTVVSEPSYVGSDQGIAFTKWMNQYKDSCEFLIGLDTDEFMFGLNENNYEFDKKYITELLNTIPTNVTYLKVNITPLVLLEPEMPYYNNNFVENPARNMTTFTNEKENIGKALRTKVFYRSNAFVNTENGNHTGRVSWGNTQISTIGYIHFHYTGPKRLYERSRNVVRAYKYVDINDSYETQFTKLKPIIGRCNGFHRVEQYLTFLLREYILNKFIENTKRLPSPEELDEVFEKFSIHHLEQLNTLSNYLPISSTETVEIPYTQDEKENVLYWYPSVLKFGHLYASLMGKKDSNDGLANRLRCLYE